MASINMKMVLDKAVVKKIASLEPEAKEKIYAAIRSWGVDVVSDIREVIQSQFKHRGGGLARSIRQDLRKGVGNEIGTLYFRSRTDTGTEHGNLLEHGGTVMVPAIEARMKMPGVVRIFRKNKIISPEEPAWTMRTRAHFVTVPPHPYLGPTIERNLQRGIDRIVQALDEVTR